MSSGLECCRVPAYRAAEFRLRVLPSGSQIACFGGVGEGSEEVKISDARELPTESSLILNGPIRRR